MNKKQVLSQQLISGALFVAVLVMLGWLSVRFKTEIDWTAGNRNSLTESSVKQLESMPDPITMTVFMYPRSEIRQSLEADIEKYQRVKADITLTFIDPSTQPQKVKEYNVSQAGEMVIEYQGRRESVTASTEPVLTGALQRLSYAGERWVVFLEGHGERDINDQDREGYAAYAQSLRDKGLKVRTLNLATDPRVPDNAAVLVVASPRKKPLDGEAKLIAEYVERGGNLLWLADPEHAPGLEAVAKTLGVTWQKGTGILLESAALGLPAFVYVTTQYPANPITKDFAENALFPLVRGLTTAPANDFNAQPLLTTTENAWLETGPIEGELALEPEQGDTQGPLTLGASFTREIKAAEGEAKSQRVVVIGDSDFLNNSYLSQLGNGSFGINLAQWLSSRDTQLNIDVPKAQDRALELPAWGYILIYAFFAFLLPAGLLGFGVTRWVIRRRR